MEELLRIRKPQIHQKPLVMRKPDKPLTPAREGIWHPQPIVPGSPNYGMATAS
jgi:hypothetical protein